MARDVVDDVRRQLFDEVGRSATAMSDLVRAAAPLAGPAELAELEHEVVASLRGLGRLEVWMRRDDVSDVLVNGNGGVWIEASGALESTGVRVEPVELMAALERAFRPLGVAFDRAHPDAEAVLVDGSRLVAVLPPLSLDGPVVAIRKFRPARLALGDFAAEPVVRVLEALVDRRYNLVVFGATGSGKTSLVNALGERAARSARLVVIEDTAELSIRGPQVVRLQTRHAASSGDRSMRDLVRLALRLRPDRLVIGEVRGPEADDMIWALSTGHTGSLSTVHARSPEGALGRLHAFCAMASGLDRPVIEAQVSAAIDAVIGMRRGVDGHREVASISMVDDTGRLSRLVDDRGART